MKKKGFLLATEVVKIVLSIISISFLIYLLIAIYYANSNNQKLQDAKATIKRVGEVISRVNSGKIIKEDITDITPSSWNFFSFVGVDKKPNSCAGENCLCICDAVSFNNFLWSKNRQIAECDKNGVCLAVKNLDKFKTFEIKSPSDGGTNVKILKFEKNIEVKEYES